ncbi:hypothetical protein FOQG_03191 [Fusarium oxysporum f. sp. raphani 54005]|uniref:Uncharacterized protein n=5 Tax=Fusarium oxysporum TaxID=5507 RepID=X0DNS4_FUSOX|nr:hypothetical protein FOXG_17973 [Fusarium oxysporum f. sp. lycopersici 4287]EXA52119.1 hypothetical protein FOVG_00539 [Fusarium oxysporum f. sp. pisi HDV247]EXK48920.1 hypothetical protein FOMG_01654 [Fusarium oxysporum f. sp. melonis 26406]EXK95987.1 hypothetical protein FOQG_03191 [Fusarium oxysporum f. sp. raphani 54005]EXL89575.1 hypothetical protein FOPG_00221 [Fusarium oxysporum f. sp. conglutinans race 2 54008]KAI8418197.1 hypothetical protein FOFC_00763 [Fusarium oxysporum]
MVPIRCFETYELAIIDNPPSASRKGVGSLSNALVKAGSEVRLIEN